MVVATSDPVSLRTQDHARSESAIRSFVIVTFVVSLLMPIILNFGPFAMSPSRLLMLLSFFPTLFLWASGRLGRVRPLDFMLIMAALWAGTAMLVNHGVAKGYERAGFVVVEMVGGYFFGRTMIRSVKDFRVYMGAVMVALLFMLPFAIIETQTGDPILIEILGKVIETENPLDYDTRLGMERAQVLFPHMILYGVFCAAMLGPTARGYNYGAGFMKSSWRIFLVLGNTFCSLSSGAWLMFIAQTGLLLYDRLFQAIRSRWLIFFSGVGFCYLLLSLVANSSPIKVFIRYLTLNPASGFYRLAQFDIATFNIANRPIFGFGANPIVKPRWMTASIDDYWLVLAVRYGIPMVVLLLGGILITMFLLSRLRPAEEEVREIRAGYLIGLGGFVLAAATVHVWMNVGIWFMFYLGAGMWLFDARQAQAETKGMPAARASARRDGKGDAEPEPESAPQPQRGRYSRFPVQPRQPARGDRIQRVKRRN